MKFAKADEIRLRRENMALRAVKLLRGESNVLLRKNEMFAPQT